MPNLLHTIPVAVSDHAIVIYNTHIIEKTSDTEEILKRQVNMYCL